MDYFELVPIEILEIIVAYLPADDVENFIEIPRYPLNWSDVYSHRYGEYRKINYSEYLRYLKGENLLKWLQTLDSIEASFDSEIRLKYDTKSFSIDSLFKLTVLDLSYKNITHIPEEIGILDNLVELCLNRNRIGPGIPLVIFNLKKLKILAIGYSNIQYVPPEISNLFDLEMLYLNDNKLASIPREVYLLSKLKLLSIAMNQIRELPDGISNLTNLKELLIYSNRLQRLPKDFDVLRERGVHVRNI